MRMACAGEPHRSSPVTWRLLFRAELAFSAFSSVRQQSGPRSPVVMWVPAVVVGHHGNGDIADLRCAPAASEDWSCRRPCPNCGNIGSALVKTADLPCTGKCRRAANDSSFQQASSTTRPGPDKLDPRRRVGHDAVQVSTHCRVRSKNWSGMTNSATMLFLQWARRR